MLNVVVGVVSSPNKKWDGLMLSLNVVVGVTSLPNKKWDGLTLSPRLNKTTIGSSLKPMALTELDTASLKLPPPSMMVMALAKSMAKNPPSMMVKEVVANALALEQPTPKLIALKDTALLKLSSPRMIMADLPKLREEIVLEECASVKPIKGDYLELHKARENSVRAHSAEHTFNRYSPDDG